ncbi:MAG: hypothetical protein II225_04520 [Ruminococcus sp.]|nr:hypothetical protein [Ruminococcus sp.]
MKNKNYLRPLILVAALLTVLTLGVFIFFEGNTYASFTLENLTLNLFVKAFVCALLMVFATTVYLVIRYKKNGLYLGIYTGLSAVISTVVTFDLCVLCRAPLGDITFALLFLSLCVTYTACAVFAGNMVKKASKKKKADNEISPYQIAVANTRKAFSAIFAVFVVTIVAAAVISFIFGAFNLSLCAAPAILSAAYSFAFFLSFAARKYADKI